MERWGFVFAKCSSPNPLSAPFFCSFIVHFIRISIEWINRVWFHHNRWLILGATIFHSPTIQSKFLCWMRVKNAPWLYVWLEGRSADLSCRLNGWFEYSNCNTLPHVQAQHTAASYLFCISWSSSDVCATANMHKLQWCTRFSHFDWNFLKKAIYFSYCLHSSAGIEITWKSLVGPQIKAHSSLVCQSKWPSRILAWLVITSRPWATTPNVTTLSFWLAASFHCIECDWAA